ncbi:hypothetical protein, partial [Methylobrevis pamukkalensis]|uniref:hypothetical protein n=1 Tax=Methylobrevis pamukkalensis TaxID=1439726 RepID=UPI000A61852C
MRSTGEAMTRQTARPGNGAASVHLRNETFADWTGGWPRDWRIGAGAAGIEPLETADGERIGLRALLRPVAGDEAPPVDLLTQQVPLAMIEGALGAGTLQ